MGKAIALKDVGKILLIFKALSSRTRFDIVVALIEHKECSVNTIAELLKSPQSSISQQLSILKNAGIIEGYRKATQVYYRVVSEQTKKIISVLGAK